MTQVHRAACHPCGHAFRICSALCFACSCACPLHPVPRHTPPSLSYWGSRLYIVPYRLGNWGKVWGWGLRFACRREVSACQCPSRPLGLRCRLHGWPHVRVLVPAASANCPVAPRVGCPPSPAFLSNTAVLEGGGEAQEPESRGCHRAGQECTEGVPWGLGSVWLHQSPRGCRLLRDTHRVPMRRHSPGDTLGSAHSY